MDSWLWRKSVNIKEIIYDKSNPHLQEESFYGDKLNGCYMNYSGSKWRYMREIHTLLPKALNIKVLDLFCGGAGAASHLPTTWSIVANDSEHRLTRIHSSVVEELDLFLGIADDLVDQYRLTNKNEMGYKLLKECYNSISNQDPAIHVDLYLLMCHSFSNQIRFNDSGEFNLPFGKRTFNKNMRKKLIRFSGRCNERNIDFVSKDFREFNFDQYDFLFVDPPYVETTATYNEKGGWGYQEEKELLSRLKKTSAKWMLTNQIISKGKESKLLVDFLESGGYSVHILKDTTKNCNYQRKSGETVEVIVTNY